MVSLSSSTRRDFLFAAGALGAATLPSAAGAQTGNAYKLNISWPPGD